MSPVAYKVRHTVNLITIDLKGQTKIHTVFVTKTKDFCFLRCPAAVGAIKPVSLKK